MHLTPLNVGGPFPRVLLARDLTAGARGRSRLRARILEIPSQEWNAPAATGPRSPALAELAGAGGAMDAEVVLDLPPGHMKTKADFIIRLHQQALSSPQGAAGWHQECRMGGGAPFPRDCG